MIHVGRPSPRTLFILRHGVLPWGLVVGTLITAFVARDLSARHTASDGLVHLVVLVALCFLGWSLGVGWVIGSALWGAAGEHTPPRDARSSRRVAR